MGGTASRVSYNCVYGVSVGMTAKYDKVEVNAHFGLTNKILHGGASDAVQSIVAFINFLKTTPHESTVTIAMIPMMSLDSDPLDDITLTIAALHKSGFMGKVTDALPVPSTPHRTTIKLLRVAFNERDQWPSGFALEFHPMVVTVIRALCAAQNIDILELVETSSNY